MALAQAARELPCALDVTVVLPEATYASDVHFVLASMVQQGFTLDAVLNYWLDSDKRRGIQVWFWDPDMRLRCQVRFNTPGSYKCRLFRRMLIERCALRVVLSRVLFSVATTDCPAFPHSRLNNQPTLFDGALRAHQGSEELTRMWRAVAVPLATCG